MFFFGVLVAGSATAQFVAQPAAASREAVLRRTQNAEPAVANGGERVTIWTNDFSDCAEWEIGSAFAAGFTQYEEGLNFECGTGLAPSGFAPIDPINSTTADNGFMMVDSDLYGGEEGGSGIENCWFQTANPINCTDYPFVSIRFENQYYMWDGGNDDGNEYCLVEVSRDGVTWPALDSYEVSEGFVDYGDGPVQARWECWPNMATQDPVTNPTTLSFDITAAAGGQETVYLRFRWKGTWGYAWMVDDVELFETPENDITVDNYVSYTDYNTTETYEYGIWPYDQVGEIQMGVRARNVGQFDAENVVLNVEVNGADAGTTSTPINLAYQEADTVRATGYVIPAVAGTYTVDMTLDYDATDENPGDNVATQSFQVDEFLFARDNGVFSGSFPAATYTTEFQVANGFQFFEESTVHAIDVAFTSGDAGAEIQVHVLDGNLDIIASSDEFQLNPAVINANPGTGDLIWTTITLDDPYTIPAGTFALASVQSFGGQNVRVARAQVAPAQTCFVQGNFGADGLFDWYFTTANAMVRFNLDPNAVTSVEEVVAGQNFTLFQNMPNPANGTTLIRYELGQNERVSFEVMDITGKRVQAQDLGMQPAGEHQFNLNIADLAPGMYTYTLNVGGERATRKMIVK